MHAVGSGFSRIPHCAGMKRLAGSGRKRSWVPDSCPSDEKGDIFDHEVSATGAQAYPVDACSPADSIPSPGHGRKHSQEYKRGSVGLSGGKCSFLHILLYMCYKVIMTDLVCSEKDLILVVDDETMIEEMIEELVEEHGCPHVSFNDPRKALGYFRENSKRVTVMITDSRMPDLSGPALVREVRKIDSRLPIILVTNYEGEPVPDDVTLLVSFILPKPFTHAELLDVLKRALARAGS